MHCINLGSNNHAKPGFVHQDKAVQWLNSMRLGDGGFVSTVDTIVALRALVTYSYHSRFGFDSCRLIRFDSIHVIDPSSRIKDITKLTVEVDLPDSNFTAANLITGKNIADGLRWELLLESKIN